MHNAALTTSAAGIGSHFEADPELSLPLHPYFPPEIAVVPYREDGLLFEGARGTQLLAGRSARFFIPQLLARLDGRSTLPQLAAHFPSVPPKALHDAVALLFSRGLLEDGAPVPVPAPLAELAAFAGRYSDVTRVNRNRGDALARLAAARVAVAASPAQAQLAQALAGHNWGALRQVATPAELAQAGCDLLVALFVGEDAQAHAWMEQANRLGMRVLHAHVGGDAVEIGPLFVPGKSGCYHCFRQLHRAPGGGGAPDVAFWSGVLALHALHLVSRIGPCSLFNTSRVHLRTAHGPVYEERKLARLPGCPVCGLAGCQPAPEHPDARVWLLHNANDNMAYPVLRNPRDHQQHYAAANVQLTGQAPKPMYGVPRVALPQGALDVAPAWHGMPPPQARVTLADLASALRFAAGYQDTPHGRRRITPGGGGLGVSCLYLVARQVDGLAAGVYRYFGFGHELERLGDSSDELLQGALGCRDPLPPALVVGTVQMHKLRQKYDNFSFRLGTLDAGVARAYLCEALCALGLAHNDFTGARDKVLAHILRLPIAGNGNMVSFALGVGDGRAQSGQPDLTLHHYHYPDALIEMSSQLGPAALPPPALAQRQAAPPGPSLGQILLARRSQRAFAPRAVPLAQLEAILAIGAGAQQLALQAGGLALRHTLWLVRTLGDADAPAGIYRWDHAQQRLAPHGALPAQSLLESCMSQRSFARAPLVLFVSGDFEQAVTSHGARGYREMLGRAGAILARTQIGAAAHGVAGCMWGGIAEDACGEVLGIDRYRDCPLFGAALGYAHE